MSRSCCNILCINTAFSGLQIAVAVNGKTLCGETLPLKSSENVLVQIEEMLGACGADVLDVDVIGVVVGPGSFTGLRVGVAIVKGVCAVKKSIKICALGSMDLMALAHLENKAGATEQGAEPNGQQDFCTVLNALGGRFFVQEFAKNGKAKFEARLLADVPAAHKIGLADERLGEVQEYVSITSAHLLEATKTQIANQNFVAAEKLAPVYLRLSQAEENLLNKEGADAEN